jgi:membrane protease YdiL (CAAX protease family)
MNIQRTPILPDRSPFSMIIYSSLAVILIGLAFQLVGLLLATQIFGISAIDLLDLGGDMDKNTVNAVKLLQIIGALGTFVFSSFIISYLYTGSLTKFFLFGKNIDMKAILLLIVIMFAILPFINLISELNMRFHFPFDGIENYFRNMEEQSESLMLTLLKADTFGTLLINLFMIAIIPAIGEELVFRGLIQKHLTDFFKNPHIAIFLASMIFSLAHFQIYSFLPRLFLGMILGYTYFYGKSLWYPMIGHLLNNSLGVIFYYKLENIQKVESPGMEALEDIGTIEMMPGVAIISLALCVFLMYVWIKIVKSPNQSEPDLL